MPAVINIQCKPTPTLFLPEGGGGDAVPDNALRDEDGNPILDEDGDYILTE